MKEKRILREELKRLRDNFDIRPFRNEVKNMKQLYRKQRKRIWKIDVRFMK